MTISQTVFVEIKEAEERGYLEMSPMKIFLERAKSLEVENPGFNKETVFVIDGIVFKSCGCSSFDAERAEDYDYEYCPYCGAEISEHIHFIFKNEEEAMNHKHYKELGCRMMLSVTARRKDNPEPKKGELF